MTEEMKLPRSLSAWVYRQSLRYIVAALCFLVSIPLLSPGQAQERPVIVPQHAQVAGYGVVLGLRGEKPNSPAFPARLTDDATLGLKDKDFKYEGFLLHSIHVEGLNPVEGSKDTWRLLGLVVFEDLAARRVYTEFSAYYKIKSDHVSIYWAAAAARTPDEPTIAWFAIEAEKIPKNFTASSNHGQILKFAVDNSLENLPKSQKIKKKYVIMAISLDRFDKDEKASFKASSSNIDVETYDFAGWPVGVFRGKMTAQDIGYLKHFQMLSTVEGVSRTVSRLDKFPDQLIKVR